MIVKTALTDGTMRVHPEGSGPPTIRVPDLHGVRVLVVDDLALQSGFQLHLVKPIGPAELMAAAASLARCVS